MFSIPMNWLYGMDLKSVSPYLLNRNLISAGEPAESFEVSPAQQ